MVAFSLLPPRLEFAGHLAEGANNEAVARNLRDVFPHPYSLQDAEDFLRFCQEQDETKQLYRLIVVEGRACGSLSVCAGNDVARKSAELGYWLAEPFWGQGIMTRAVGQICEEAFRKMDIVRIFAEPFSYNQASRRVLEYNGFQLEGILRQSVYKRGQLYDACMYALLKETKV